MGRRTHGRSDGRGGGGGEGSRGAGAGGRVSGTHGRSDGRGAVSDDPLAVTVRGVVIPADELTWRFSRSPGPGGQSVNTTDSRVSLSFDLGASGALRPELRDR